MSDTLTRKKSVFLARATPVASEKEAKENVKHLVTTDKKASKANHNITAWRIRNDAGREVQNSNDDGESAAGGKVLTLMQMMDVWDVMVVVTRWFGGIKLGPERFRVINAAAKDALDKGGWNKPRKQESDGNDKGTKKKKKR
ncbi:eIF2 kinase Gcn2p negative regulator [Ascosphaera atra]|nr:eIF2 kinase Gcn2p negative regulator [Ascosphaera atra]